MVLVDKSGLADEYENIKHQAAKSGGGCTILLFVAPDGDSISACKVLTVDFLARVVASLSFCYCLRVVGVDVCSYSPELLIVCWAARAVSTGVGFVFPFLFLHEP